MKISKIFLSFAILAAIALNMAGCATLSLSAQATDLMEGVVSRDISGRAADDAFVLGAANFSLELFKKSISAKQNSLVSPLSAMLALAMTANGAGGETLAQMERLLGGGISLGELNEYLYAYAKALPNEKTSKLSIANSIWFRDDETLRLEPRFLQNNADYYGASAYKSVFNAQTAKDINNWVKSKTDKMIEKIVENISENDMLYLINAVAFEAEWREIYKQDNIQMGDFTDIDAKTQNVDFMFSAEGRYIDDGKATGFTKPYAGSGYSFAALLPNEGVDILEYINSLSGAGFVEAIKNAEVVTVYAYMPKFEFDYDIVMNDALKALGMPEAFDKYNANFSNMADLSDEGDNIYIGEVRHKTYIAVNERGTRAGAATSVKMKAAGAMPSEPKTVRLDRPFVFAIIDNATNLPIFIGTLMSIG